MPIAVILLFLSPILIGAPVAINEQAQMNKVNEICIKKFNTNEDIKVCKQVLLKTK